MDNMEGIIMAAKRPALQFYPSDWRKDAALQSCSLEAQGLWINLICIAHECEPYGYLAINGTAMTTKMIARLIGISETKTKRILAELEANFVLSREQNCIFSRRMVRDKKAYDEYIETCRQQGLKGKEHGVKGGRPKAENNPPPGSDPVMGGVILKPGDNPSSSSSSSSPSGIKDNNTLPADAGVQKPPDVKPSRKRTRQPKTDAKPEHGITVELWRELWKAKYGDKYTFIGRDFKIIQNLLDRFNRDPEKLRPIFIRYLADKDLFHAADSRHSLAKLETGINRYTVDAPLPVKRTSQGFMTHDERVMAEIMDAQLAGGQS